MRDKCSAELEGWRIETIGNTPVLMEYQINNKGMCGTFFIKSQFGAFFVISSMVDGWDHVSVSKISKKDNKIPTWKEMVFIKGIFFKDSETVIQYHFKKNSYVSHSPTTLHLWRKQDDSMPVPPMDLI